MDLHSNNYNVEIHRCILRFKLLYLRNSKLLHNVISFTNRDSVPNLRLNNFWVSLVKINSRGFLLFIFSDTHIFFCRRTVHRSDTYFCLPLYEHKNSWKRTAVFDIKKISLFRKTCYSYKIMQRYFPINTISLSFSLPYRNIWIHTH